ncbi:uncharacterized protein LOC116350354 [Contarinia nasturtii]|uniref:uncharacterized protein LOC116350354 n=1 Tax=Contarinia nasturtii TaxID=265458 RepID=UPI0012D45F28|nr:uncharacterized protein LOC116350354 [Contarinia nasturtii]
MTDISEKAANVKTEYRSVAPFITKDMKLKVLAKVPKEMQIDGKNARRFLSREITSINSIRMINITKLNEEIITGLNFNSPSDYDNEFREPFDASFNSWNETPVKKADLQRVEKHLKVMLAQHAKLEERFDRVVSTIANLIFRANAVQTIDCEISFDDIIDATDTEVITSIINDRLLAKLNEMTQKQSELSVQLEDLKSIISRYNIQRTIWARFIIGTEKTPRSA